MEKRLYPGGKKKVFTVSYDDGITQDVRFISLLNRYGIKGTFNLNSELMQTESTWVHETGMVVKRLSPAAAQGLYDGHEIASHSLTHPYFEEKPRAFVLHEMGQDRENLRSLFGQEVSGFAAPFDYWSPLMAECAKECGFEYSRISEISHSYALPEDLYYWRPGIFHLEKELDEYVDGFLETDEELAICQIVGHSYDLDAENLWEKMEDIFRRVSQAEDVAFMTTIEIVRHLKALGVR